MNTKFLNFLDKIHEVNPELINTIISGFNLIESLSTDDANGKPNGQVVSHPSVASTVNYQNPSTEYFPQTLPDELNNTAIMSQTGSRIAQLPPSGRTSLGKDTLKSSETSNYSASYGQTVN
jgi:hypothetical protein